MLSSAAIKQHAAELGFDLCGIAPAHDFPELTFLSEWLARGYAGEMEYMSKSADRRADIRNFLPSARSVIVTGTSTTPRIGESGIREPGAGDRDRGPDRALRARSGLSQRARASGCRRCVEWMRTQQPEPFDAELFVDKHHVQERVFAQHAGLGWIGKNTCVINREHGSWMFLAGIATSLDARVRRAGLRSVRRLHALHRRLSDRRARRRPRARCDEVHFVSHHRGGRRHPGRAAAADRQSCVWLRHLPGRVSVESRRADDEPIRRGRVRSVTACRPRTCGNAAISICTR